MHKPIEPGCGSSPLVRGSEIPGKIKLTPYRFIPARAGIGYAHGWNRGRWAVHPRSCGDREEAGRK